MNYGLYTKQYKILVVFRSSNIFEKLKNIVAFMVYFILYTVILNIGLGIVVFFCIQEHTLNAFSKFVRRLSSSVVVRRRRRPSPSAVVRRASSVVVVRRRPSLSSVVRRRRPSPSV